MPRNCITRTVSVVITIVVIMSNSVCADPVIIATPGTSLGGLAFYDLDVDPNGSSYDTIDVVISGSNFNQTGGAIFVAPGSNDTGFLLDVSIAGFNSFGVSESNANLVGVWSSLGGTGISAGTINLAQIVFQAGSMPGISYSFQFADAGDRVATVTGTVPTVVPEPASVVHMAASALLLGIGLIGARFVSRKPTVS